MEGPGKYDDLCTLVREQAQADAAIVIVFNGKRGSGFSVQAPIGIALSLAETLSQIANDMRHEATSMIIGEIAHGGR
jgi:hypothetical protein